MKTTENPRTEHFLDKAARLAGGRMTLASLLDVSAAAIGNWKIRSSVPIEHCVAIERATAGAVSRRDLRPDDWREIWPELADLETDQALPSADRSCEAIESVAVPHPAMPIPPAVEAAASVQPGA